MERFSEFHESEANKETERRKEFLYEMLSNEKKFLALGFMLMEPEREFTEKVFEEKLNIINMTDQIPDLKKVKKSMLDYCTDSFLKKNLVIKSNIGYKIHPQYKEEALAVFNMIAPIAENYSLMQLFGINPETRLTILYFLTSNLDEDSLMAEGTIISLGKAIRKDDSSSIYSHISTLQRLKILDYDYTMYKKTQAYYKYLKKSEEEITFKDAENIENFFPPSLKKLRKQIFALYSILDPEHPHTQKELAQRMKDVYPQYKDTSIRSLLTIISQTIKYWSQQEKYVKKTEIRRIQFYPEHIPLLHYLTNELKPFLEGKHKNTRDSTTELYKLHTVMQNTQLLHTILERANTPRLGQDAFFALIEVILENNPSISMREFTNQLGFAQSVSGRKWLQKYRRKEREEKNFEEVVFPQLITILKSKNDYKMLTHTEVALLREVYTKIQYYVDEKDDNKKEEYKNYRSLLETKIVELTVKTGIEMTDIKSLPDNFYRILLEVVFEPRNFSKSPREMFELLSGYNIPRQIMASLLGITPRSVSNLESAKLNIDKTLHEKALRDLLQQGISNIYELGAELKHMGFTRFLSPNYIRALRDRILHEAGQDIPKEKPGDKLSTRIYRIYKAGLEEGVSKETYAENIGMSIAELERYIRIEEYRLWSKEGFLKHKPSPPSLSKETLQKMGISLEEYYLNAKIALEKDIPGKLTGTP